MVLAGIAARCAGLCYAEFASTVPIAGSAYTYAYATLGEFVAWIIGWDLILEYALGAATVAVGWSGYFTSFLHDFVGLAVPRAARAAPGTIVQTAAGRLTGGLQPAGGPHHGGRSRLLIVIGIKESATVNAVIVIIKVAVVLIVIVVGAAFIEPGELARRSSRRTPARSASTAGAASCAAPA